MSKSQRHSEGNLDAYGGSASRTLIVAHAFSPASVAGCIAWMTTPVSSSGSLWVNNALVGVDAVQPTTSLQPAYQATGINGAPSILSDGVDDSMKITLPATYTTFSVMAVVKAVTVTGVYGVVFGNLFQDGRNMLVVSRDDNTLQMWINGASSQAGKSAPDSFVPGTAYLVAVTYDGTTLNLYINNTLQISAPVAGEILSPDVYLGYVFGFNPGNNHYSDVFIYSRAITGPELTSLYDYVKPLRGLA